MDVRGKSIVITGGGNGIGEAFARRFSEAGAANLLIADLDGDGAQRVASDIGALAMTVDVSSERGNVEMIALAESEFGAIDLLCLNAGIAEGGGPEAPDDLWMRSWNVNVMAHVWALRAALPAMLARQDGYVLHTTSAAGLLTNIGAGPYSVTKHAVQALAEWVAMTYKSQGLKVSCVCPQGVRTNMLLGDDNAATQAILSQGAIDPVDVAEAVVKGLAEEQFLIFPHPEVQKFFRNRATDTDRWITAMSQMSDAFLSLSDPDAVDPEVSQSAEGQP